MIRVGREMATNAFDTASGVEPLKQIEDAELALYKVAEQGEVSGSVKTFGTGDRLAIEMADRAMKSGGHLSGYTTGLDALNAKIGGLHDSATSSSSPSRPAMGKTSARDEHRLLGGAAVPARPRRRDRGESRAAPASPSSASR